MKWYRRRCAAPTATRVRLRVCWDCRGMLSVTACRRSGSPTNLKRPNSTLLFVPSVVYWSAMISPRVFLAGILLLPLTLSAQTLAERLGYPAGTKLIIVHADDLGETHAVNAAVLKALQGGTINSASLMVPCPWFPEMADYAKSHPDADFGLHLTLTAERGYYRWSPVAPGDKVPSLIDANGYFHHDWDPSPHINAKEAEIELRAQIERA